MRHYVANFRVTDHKSVKPSATAGFTVVIPLMGRNSVVCDNARGLLIRSSMG